ncbi:probable phenylalanine--tRNA ligase, mitochondrial isoform X1 [Contarinia nasturtii]|uniref:probable phenylalanine--tRNA ligase, mitochondrial isoform X1 n=1 Tax=Contarinia nasturtii TaxID=265458 RepID=UPI0012D3FCD7|nr:probable phenylalanine--tRNA ligase, mitochondrial isoform X1 [Contarinia nasturtii]
MLIKMKIIEKFVQNVRCYSSSVKSIKEQLLIQKTTYKTDDWTNINSRFEPFVGANLYAKSNHPLRLTHEEVTAFFKKWFNENIDNTIELPVHKNLDPLEPNTSTEKVPNAFYVNKDLILRTHTINREVNYLKSGLDNFILICDLYRQCEMDELHFPAFHRMNIIRTKNCEKLLRRSKQKETQQAQTATHLKDEYQTALIEMAKHFLGTDVKYRWTDANLAATEPSSVFEVYHKDDWYRISGGGLIKNEIFERSERSEYSAGWEIGIGLDRLAMILFNIFDIRLLWNSSPIFLNRFRPQKISEKLQTKIESSPNNATKSVIEKIVQPTSLHGSKKKTKCEKHISFILPENQDLESFPSDQLCKYILQHTDNAAKKVDVYDTFYNSKLNTYVLNLKVEYQIGRHRTKDEINSIHNSARAHAAHNFNLTLKL